MPETPFMPDKAMVKEVVADILARIGHDQMSQLFNAIDDLLWDYYKPYHKLPDEQRKAWMEAFEAELNGDYEPVSQEEQTP